MLQTYRLPDAPVLERQIRQNGAIDKLPGEGEANIQRRTAAGGRFDGHLMPLLGCFVLVSFAVRSMSLAHVILRLRILCCVVGFRLVGDQEERFLIFSLALSSNGVERVHLKPDRQIVSVFVLFGLLPLEMAVKIRKTCTSEDN